MDLLHLAALWDLFSFLLFFIIPKFFLCKLCSKASDGVKAPHTAKFSDPVSPVELCCFHQLKPWPFVCFPDLSHYSWLLDDDNVFLPFSVSAPPRLLFSFGQMKIWNGINQWLWDLLGQGRGVLQGGRAVLGSWNDLGGKRPLRSSRPTFNPTLGWPSPPLICVPKLQAEMNLCVNPMDAHPSQRKWIYGSVPTILCSSRDIWGHQGALGGIAGGNGKSRRKLESLGFPSSPKARHKVRCWVICWSNLGSSSPSPPMGEFECSDVWVSSWLNVLVWGLF